MKGRNCLFLIICIVVGIFISIQIKIVDGDYLYVSTKALQDYEISIESEKREIESLKEIIINSKKQIKEYKDITNEGGLLIDAMRKELDYIKTVNGFYDLQGEGVMIVLNDGTRELFELEDAENIMVHDFDIINIINDLKVAGAEAISINGQRLLSTSEINCSGHSVRINNQFFAQPFVIKAIGNSELLFKAVTDDKTYGDELKLYGIYIDAKKEENIKIPKYSEELKTKYLKIANESEGEIN